MKMYDENQNHSFPYILTFEDGQVRLRSFEDVAFFMIKKLVFSIKVWRIHVIVFNNRLL